MTPAFTGERCVPSVTPRVVFEQHESRYRLAASSFGRESTVVDVGSGSGIGTALLGSVYRRVIGMEFDASSITFARRQYALSTTNVSFVCGDAQHLPLHDESVEGAVAFEVIEHVPEPMLLLNEVWRVLQPGGIFLASTPAGEADRYLPNPFHISRLTRDQFHTAIARRFHIEGEYYQGIITRRRLVSLRMQAHLRRIPLGSQLLQFLLATWPPARQPPGKSPSEFALYSPEENAWPILSISSLPPGAVPYILVIRCRK